MALIICPECSHDVSDKAISCPNCGYPIRLSEGTKSAKKGDRWDAWPSLAKEKESEAPEQVRLYQETVREAQEPLCGISSGNGIQG